MKKRIQKRRQKAPSTKVTQRQKRVIKIAPKVQGIHPSILWDDDRTNTENYSTLGIASSLNKSLHYKPTKYQLSRIQTTLFPSRPARECEIFDSSESGTDAIGTFFQESFSTLKNGLTNNSLLLDCLPTVDDRKNEPPKNRLSKAMHTYLERLVELHGNTEYGLKAMQNDLKNNYQQFTEAKLRTLLKKLHSQQSTS